MASVTHQQPTCIGRTRAGKRWPYLVRSAKRLSRLSRIIGVLPPGFRFLNQNPQLILPFRFNRAELHAANFSFQGVARLKPGVTLEQANADVARLLPVIPDRFPMPSGLTRKMFDDVKMDPTSGRFRLTSSATWDRYYGSFSEPSVSFS
jgi:hypothetical protein